MSRRLRATGTAVALAAALAVLGACGSPTQGSAASGQSSGAAATTITVGFNAGPYEDMFEQGIRPILQAEGYTVKSQNFTDGIQVNAALDAGDIQANIMQHPVYLDFVNKQRKFDNVSLVQVPGPPMGLYAGRSSTLDVADGASVALPNEPSNLYRALLLLQKTGWVTVKPSADPGTASLNDVASNPHHLDLQLLENSQAVRALQDLDYAVVQGNFAVSSGLKLTDALELEDLKDDYSVVVAVKDGNQTTAWARAITDAYHSRQFADFISSHDEYAGYHLPAYMDAQ